jgi:hypothetical protein
VNTRKVDTNILWVHRRHSRDLKMMAGIGWISDIVWTDPAPPPAFRR